MTAEPRAFAAVDHGTATVAVSLIGRTAGRWHLLGSTAAPASVGVDPQLERLRSRLAAADIDLARSLSLGDPAAVADLPRVIASTTAPRTIVVVAATRRVLAPLTTIAAAAGWRVRHLVLEGAEILGVATALADPSVAAVLAGATDPPGADERPLIGELAAVVTAATQRRPDLIAVLAGGLADPASHADLGIAADRPGATILAPAADAGGGEPLRQLLDSLRDGEQDGRRAIATAAATLAAVLHRPVEIVDIGQSAGVRSRAAWSPASGSVSSTTAVVADAALVRPAADDASLDAVVGWLTVPLDRLRVRDRLRELVLAPWGDAAGDGAFLRLAAARAALGRLVAATPAFDALPGPDLLVAAGGVWSVAPGPAVALALADVFRRPGVRALGLDHAHLLAPLGTIEDPDERRGVFADLRDELLVPLGSVVMPAGLRSGRSAGQLEIRGSSGSAASAPIDLAPGTLELVDLPPGERAIAELRFRDAVDLGVRARQFAVEVSGGLGGLLVDLRDVPLRLPDRLERRRDLLAAWQAAMWAGADA